MFQSINTNFQYINNTVFLGSILLFFIGYTLAPTVYFKNIRWLKAYPLWIMEKLEKLIEHNMKPVALFLLIFSANAVSLFINLISGYIPYLPVLFAILTGINIGIVTYKSMEGKYYFLSLLNPIALLELPVAFLSFTMAIQLNLSNLAWQNFFTREIDFGIYLNLFLTFILPVLIVAGILESAFIRLSHKIKNSDDL